VATTPEDERKAKAYVDRWQKKLRELTGETGLPRQYRREGGRVRLSEAAKRLGLVRLDGGTKTRYTDGVPNDLQLKYTRITDKNTFSRAINRTNPHYGEGPEYKKNCTHSVIAYEMRRRGYEVIASPAILDEQERISPKDTLANGFGYVKAFEGAINELCVKTNDKQQVIDRMTSWGDGARAIVRIVWKDHENEPGHVFIAEQINGKTYFLDPQSGASNCEGYFTKSRKGATMIMRVDNCRVTDHVNEAVLPDNYGVR